MLKLTAMMAAVGITVYGFQVEHKSITDCVATVELYSVADFEEDYVCLNFEGKIDICTAYSTKLASHKKVITTTNGSSAGRFMRDGYYYDFPPAITKDFTQDTTFIDYRQVDNATITAKYNDGSLHRKHDYLQCMLDRGNEFEVLTWYGTGGLHI